MFDVAVVGGGVVGLATAWELTLRDRRLRMAVLEAEAQVAQHQSTHNSGVVHAGVYYAPGSLKATLCREGNQMLAEFCADHDIPLLRNGKVVVATEPAELDGLAEIYRRCRANQVPGAAMLDPGQLRAVEPLARGIAAVHSPRTGVVDFGAVARALAEELRVHGTEIKTNWRVANIHRNRTGPGATIVGPGGAEVHAKRLVVAGGLQSDRLTGGASRDRIVPFRGSWFIVDQHAAEGLRGSIYPVPDPKLPFLGVHVTRRIDGQVWAGPNAFLALSRSDYKRWALRASDATAALAFPGLWRFAAAHPKAVITELTHEVSARSYAKQVQRYVPSLGVDDLTRGPMGIRAQMMTREGRLLDDFSLQRSGDVLHVLNAPSPAATSSLAIGRHIANLIST